MKKILIIYPHYPPSNLAGVHRPRLFANHLKDFGWEPVVLTVHEDFYEEPLDRNLEKLLPKDQRIVKVDARPRKFGIGDIGLRAYDSLYKKALEIIGQETIDFVFIPIPSFYAALLGPKLHKATGVKYGIDYIDPWVHKFPGSNTFLSKAWFSTRLAKILEPKAVKNASLITGVAAGYYENVLQRNPHLRQQAQIGAMPYGGEIADHMKAAELNLQPYLFSKNEKQQLVYAGAMLPKAYSVLEEVMQSIAKNKFAFKQLEIHFIGSGYKADDDKSYNIKALAEKYSLWNEVFFEHPKRIPYLDVIAHLNAADGVFILGSTEPHYTPSKAYQAIMSNKPIFALLHSKSTAVEVIRDSNGGIVLDFGGESGLQKIGEDFFAMYQSFLAFQKSFLPSQVNRELFENYSSRAVTKQLVDLLNKID